jgi:hypothetical protein
VPGRTVGAPEQEAAVFTVVCPSCVAEVSLPARKLLVGVGTDEPSGELLFTCLACHATPVVPIDPAAIADLLLAGVSHLCLAPVE